MYKVALLFGGLLIALAVVSYGLAAAGVGRPATAAATEATAATETPVKGPSATLFIPAIFGAILMACGAAASKPSLRKHAMHAAAAVALLGGLVAGGRGASKLFAPVDPTKETNWLATASVWSMAILCLVFVALCVRSFIAARREREAAAIN